MQRSLEEIYTEYKIMPQLAAHQIRVAAVAHTIARAFKGNLAAEELVSACLLHDMGNILKFDLAYFPEFLEPHGFAYWEDIKAQFQAAYGTDEHAATLAIAREVGVSDRTIEYINSIGFSNANMIAKEDSFENKIACYADMRVAPSGIVSLNDRLAEGRQRYAGRVDRAQNESFLLLQTSALEKIEKQIFEYTDITPEDITEEQCEKYFSSLRDYKII